MDMMENDMDKMENDTAPAEMNLIAKSCSKSTMGAMYPIHLYSWCHPLFNRKLYDFLNIGFNANLRWAI